MLACSWLTERAYWKLRQLGNPVLVEPEGQVRSHVNSCWRVRGFLWIRCTHPISNGLCQRAPSIITEFTVLQPLDFAVFYFKCLEIELLSKSEIKVLKKWLCKVCIVLSLGDHCLKKQRFVTHPFINTTSMYWMPSLCHALCCSLEIMF